MLRVLHIMGCSDAGGISSVVRTYYQFIDRTKVHFDIALTIPTEGQNSRALQAMGAEIFFIPMKGEDREGFCRELTKLLKTGNYDAIHVHESETCYVALKIAKNLGIPCRIAHAHTSSPYEGIRSVIRRLSGCMLNSVYATHVIACGEKAGSRVFGKWNMKGAKALVLPNAVDTRRFAFNPQIRTQVRQELGVSDRLVLGMVCRLSEEKNIPFALKLLKILREQNPHAVLLIAGNGPEEEAIRQLAEKLELGDSFRLLGRREDVERLYQAYDLLLLPSIHEGFPVVAVEAMASGLPILMSDTITRELQFGSAVRYLPLNSPAAWVQAVDSFRGDSGRELRGQEPKQQGLDIRNCARILEQIYEKDTAAGSRP